MSNRITKLCLAAFYIVASFVIGCLPEDSLQWSEDGSKGIYSKNGELFLVDGGTGELTQIAVKGTTTKWPAISPDGSMFAYGTINKADDFSAILKKLPSSEFKTIASNAEVLKQKILAEDVKDGNLAPLEGPFNEQHLDWVKRYLVEKADAALTEQMGTQLNKKIKEKNLTYYELVLAQAADPNNRKILIASTQPLWRIQFSPDSKLIAFVLNKITGKEYEVGFDLYVTKSAENHPPAFVASAVATGYDFRPDSRAIAYLKPENENFKGQELVLGSLVEKILIDPNGKFLVSPALSNAEGTENDVYTCTGDSKAYAGVLYNSWMKVSYGRDGRIFFSSSKITIPSGKTETAKSSIFCCDTLTGGVSDLSWPATDFTKGNFYLFELSRDSKKMLLHGEKNSLACYVLGPDLEASKLLVDANEGFGNDLPKLVAGWKGPDRISCLVSEKSHYLTSRPNTPHRRKEIVILDDKGNLIQVLSKSWPDELLDFD